MVIGEPLQATEYNKPNDLQNWKVATKNRYMLIKVHARWVHVFVQISYDS